MRTLQHTNAWLPAIFEDFIKEGRLDVPNTKSFTNSVNITENEKEFALQVLAPGFSKKSFTIEVEKNTLIIAGKIIADKTTTDNETVKFTRKEFVVSDFKRSFNLPETIDVEGIKANYKNGILLVSLPKIEEVAAKKKMVEIS